MSTMTPAWLIQHSSGTIQISDGQQKIRYSGSKIGLAQHLARDMSRLEQWLPEIQKLAKKCDETVGMSEAAGVLRNLYGDLHEMAGL